MDTDCQHPGVMPTFDETEAKKLLGPDDPASEIRRRWPRYVGHCPHCGESVTLYASYMHYFMGDW